MLFLHKPLELGQGTNSICNQLGLKIGTVKRAVQAGRIIIPAKTNNQLANTTKSQRNVIDNDQAMGKACSNVLERVLAIQAGSKLSNYLQQSNRPATCRCPIGIASIDITRFVKIWG